MTRSRLLFAAVLGALFALASPAAADPTKHECIAANEAAQDLRSAGKLRDARAKLALCMASSCPGPVREDCGLRLSEVDAVTPSIVFEVKDGAGSDLSAVRVTIDGQPFIERLDGSTVPVDRGQHRFVFEAEGMGRMERILVIHEGDKGRHERVVFDAVKASPASESVPRSAGEPSSPHRLAIPTLSYVAAGIGVVGLAVGIGAGIAADDKHSALESQGCPANGGICPPNADQGDLDAFHSLRTVSTIGYVIGAACIAGGVALWVLAPKTAATETKTSVWIGPGSAGVVGTF
ncbi:MAG TPA: hypothetical protein VGY54_02350 [Polyangiaceae bacterium]|jgi:hypothetical protein|nr:hypothetical protein [Polyangiaceae bacterium]